MAMTLTFLGATETVTGSKYLVTIDDRLVLVEAGMFQGERRWREKDWEPFAVPPASITDVVITHAHADHCAYLPALVAQGFTGRIWATPATRELAAIVLRDAARLQERETEQAIQGGYSKHRQPRPLYTVADAERTLPMFREARFDTDTDLGRGLTARFTRAGHILGSASVTLRHGDDGVLFSGDLGRHDHPVLRARDVPDGAPYVVIESTYGDREHPDPAGLPHEDFAAAIRRTISRGGSVLVPAFAVDRTEIVLKALAEMRTAGRIPLVPIIVNSPMAVATLAVYRGAAHSGELRQDLDPAEFINLTQLQTVTDPEESRSLNHPKASCIIISSSGMANGGRVLHHLAGMLPDPRHSIVLTGYQAYGTRGRDLLEGAKQIKIRGSYVPVKAEIVLDREFSVHADRSDLLDWLSALHPAPQTVFCTHGETSSTKALAARITADLGLTAVAPRYGEVVSLDTHRLAEVLGVPVPVVRAEPSPVVRAEPVPVVRPEPVPERVPVVRVEAAPPVRVEARPARGPADTHADDAAQVEVILEVALGQLPFLAAEKRPGVEEALRTALRFTHDLPAQAPQLREATNNALYAAAEAVETPGGQSIVALLAHIPKVLGRP